MVRPRKLTINLLWLYGGEFTGKLLGLIAFGYLSRTLGVERYGDLELAIALVFVLNLVQEAGLMPYGAREAAKRPDRVVSLAAKIVWVRAIVAVATLAVLGLLALLLSSPLIGKSTETVQLVLLCGLLLIPGPLVLNWVFQSRDEMAVVAWTSLLRNAVMAGGVFVFVRSAADAWAMPCCDVLGLAAAIGVQHVLFRRRVGRLSLVRGLAGTREVLRDATPIAVSSLAWALRVFLPVIVLGAVSAEANASFASGHRLVTALHAFVWLYFFNLLPSLSRALQGPDRRDYRALTGGSLRLVSWCVLTGCLALYAVAPVLLPAVYGSLLADAAGPFRVSVWMVAVAFLSGHQRYSLIAAGRQADELRASSIGALVSILGCSLLVTSPSPMLAAGVLVAAELATLVAAEWWLARRVEPMRLVSHLAGPLAVLLPVVVLLVVVLPDRPVLGALAALVLGSAGAMLMDGRRLREAVRRARSGRDDAGAADS